MNITFNLKDAKMFIPHGRFMNLKGKLDIKKGELTDEDIREIVKNAVAQEYTINYNIEKQITNLASNFLNNNYYKETRERLYERHSNSWFSNHQYNIAVGKLKSEQLETAFNYAKERILADEKVMQKLKKLEQLRLVNNT